MGIYKCELENSVLGKDKFVIDASDAISKCLEDIEYAVSTMEKAIGIPFWSKQAYFKVEAGSRGTRVISCYRIFAGDEETEVGNFCVRPELVVYGDTAKAESTDSCARFGSHEARFIADTCLEFRKILDAAEDFGLLRMFLVRCHLQCVKINGMYSAVMSFPGFGITPMRYGGSPVLVAFSAFAPASCIVFNAPGAVSRKATGMLMDALNRKALPAKADWAFKGNKVGSGETYELLPQVDTKDMSAREWAAVTAVITLSEILGLTKSSVFGLEKRNLKGLAEFCSEVISSITG